MSTPPGATARLNGIDMYFERFGAGSRLLYLNGSGSSIDTVRAGLPRYAARFDLLIHDQRGLGRTEVPPGPYTMADYADDVLALLDHVGWDTCRVVGTSFGGMVGQQLAVTAPDRVERLALVCTSPGGTAPSYPLHRLEAMTEQERGALMLTLLDTRFTPEFLAAHPEHQQFLRMMAEHQRGAARLSADQQRGAREQLLARAGFDVIARLSRIGCPTLVASGAFDGIAPPENARLIADLVASAEYREYDGGHAFMVQDPRAVPEIIEFLAG